MEVNKSDKFKYYIALEFDGEKIVKNYYKSLSKNDKIMVDYNYEKFKETFEKEMENQDKLHQSFRYMIPSIMFKLYGFFCPLILHQWPQ